MDGVEKSQQGTPIFLLKTKTSPDGYEEYFLTKKWKPAFVPVLEHRFLTNSLAKLTSWVTSGAFNPDSSTSEERYTGLIFTSQRAVEAFAKVVANLRSSEPRALNQLTAKTLLYVVGPATARGLRALELPCPILGEESGNGEALAGFILEHHNSSHTQTATRPEGGLVFLVGEQHRDIIPKTLARGDPSKNLPSIPVTELPTYETGVMESFSAHFASLVESNLRDDVEQWVVVFSPTGCKAMLEVLGLLDVGTGRVKKEVGRRMTRVATIGPTTRDYLVADFGFVPDVCAERPSPEGLGEAVLGFERM